MSTLGGNDSQAHSLTIGDTMVLSNTTVNSLRIAVNYTDIHRTHEPIGFDAPDVGIKTHSYLEDYMLLTVTGGFTLGGGTESEARFKTPSYPVSDDMTMIRGNHQFGFGGSLAFWRSLSRANVRSPGLFSFGGANTGLGSLTSSSAVCRRRIEPAFIQAVPNTLDMQQWYVGPVRAGHVEARPKMTLNYGVRWEPAIAQQIRNGAIYNFDIDRFLAGERTTQFINAPPDSCIPVIAGSSTARPEWRTTGISGRRASASAWDPTGNGRQVIRGGYALGYDFINAQFHLNTSVAQPWGAEVRLADGQRLDDPFAGSGVTNPFPYVLGKDSPFNLFGPYIAIPPDIKTPRQQSWNLTVAAAARRRHGGETPATWAATATASGTSARSTGSVSFPGRARSTRRPAATVLPACTTAANLNFRRKLTMQNWETGKYLGALDEHTALGEQTYTGCC